MRQLLALILITGLISCSKPTSSDSINSEENKEAISDSLKSGKLDYDALFKLESYLTKTPVDTTNSQVIDFDCAIVIYPTNDQIEEMEKNEGEENFAIIVDDSNWYQGLALEMIDSVGVKTYTADKQYLNLRGENKNWVIDVRKKNLPAWNMIFFKRNKQPEIISEIDLTTQKVRDYFKD